MPKTQQFLIYFPIFTDTDTIISNKKERTVCAQRLHFSKFNTEFTAYDVQIIHKLHTNSECERCPFQRKIAICCPKMWPLCIVLRMRNEICCVRSLLFFIQSYFILSFAFSLFDFTSCFCRLTFSYGPDYIRIVVVFHPDVNNVMCPAL